MAKKSVSLMGVGENKNKKNVNNDVEGEILCCLSEHG